MKWSADFGLSVTSRLLDSLMKFLRAEKCPAVDQSGCEHSRLQEAHFPNHCQCFDFLTARMSFCGTKMCDD